MIRVLFGEDNFSITQALNDIRKSLGSPDLRDANTTVLQGVETSLEQLSAACDTIPFLSEKRLVVMEGLLHSVEPRRRRGRGQQTAFKEENSRIAQWKGLADYLNGVPDTTELVFLEGALRKDNPLLRRLSRVATVIVKGFPRLDNEPLRQWIRESVAKRGCNMDPRAVRYLADIVGGNLWIMDSEVEKLCLYTVDKEIREEDIRAIVAPAREANIFAAVDAVIEGRSALAVDLLHRLMQSGAAVSYILVMLARQLRLLMLAKEMKAHKLREDEIGRRLGISAPFVLKKTLEQERKFTFQRLRQIHARLLETDLGIKRGQITEEVALDLLIAQLCDEPKEIRARISYR